MKIAITPALFVILMVMLGNLARSQTYVKVMVKQPEALNVLLSDPAYDSDDTEVVVGEDLQINGGVLPYSLKWSDSHSVITTDSSFMADVENGAVYNLTITDARGCFAERSVTITPYSSVAPSWDRLIKIYPVPATSYIQVDLPLEMHSSLLMLFNHAGEVIWQKQVTGNCSIPLSYTPGIYFLKIKKRSLETVRKIIIR